MKMKKRKEKLDRIQAKREKLRLDGQHSVKTPQKNQLNLMKIKTSFASNVELEESQKKKSMRKSKSFSPKKLKSMDLSKKKYMKK